MEATSAYQRSINTNQQLTVIPQYTSPLVAVTKELQKVNAIENTLSKSAPNLTISKELQKIKSRKDDLNKFASGLFEKANNTIIAQYPSLKNVFTKAKHAKTTPLMIFLCLVAILHKEAKKLDYDDTLNQAPQEPLSRIFWEYENFSTLLSGISQKKKLQFQLSFPLLVALQEQNLKKFDELLRKRIKSEVSFLLNNSQDEEHQIQQRVNQKLDDPQHHLPVTLSSCEGGSILSFAALIGNPIFVEYLLHKGARADIPDNYGYLPLHRAAEKGFTEVVKLLLPHTNINAQTRTGSTALMIATETNNFPVADLLIKRGADRLIMNNNKSLPIHCAARNGYSSLLQLLMTKESINIKGYRGITPLIWASGKGHTSIVNILLRNGADPSICGENQITAAHVAAIENYFGILKLLAAYTNVHVVDGAGRTPLSIAQAKGHTQIANFLEKTAVKGKRRNHNDSSQNKPRKQPLQTIENINNTNIPRPTHSQASEYSENDVNAAELLLSLNSNDKS